MYQIQGAIGLVFAAFMLFFVKEPIRGRYLVKPKPDLVASDEDNSATEAPAKEEQKSGLAIL